MGYLSKIWVPVVDLLMFVNFPLFLYFGVIGMRDYVMLLHCVEKYDIILLKGVIVWLKITC